jgi:hypothetical protein
MPLKSSMRPAGVSVGSVRETVLNEMGGRLLPSILGSPSQELRDAATDRTLANDPV